MIRKLGIIEFESVEYCLFIQKFEILLSAD
jgi:hypothetical protein